MKQTVLIMSCEHAVNTVPDSLTHLFAERPSILTTHRATDIGALEISTHISRELKCEYTQSNVSRLLIDCNRSITHSHCFSKYSKRLTPAEKKELIDQYYTPFRNQTQTLIEKHIANNEQVLHLSVHTFAPIIKGSILTTGVGLLYDSKRHAEKEVARLWHGLLLQETPPFRIRMNYPFSGHSDSFTMALRHQYKEQDYLGIEIEVNQALLNNQEDIHDIAKALAHSLRELLELL